MLLRYDELSRPRLAQAAQAGAIALVPMAATENHGSHLPLGTDTIIAEVLIDGLADRMSQAAGSTDSVARNEASCRPLTDCAQVAALRPVWLGVSPEHASFAGTLTTSTAQFMAQLRDICDGLQRAGFERVLLFNAHGGNAPPAKAFAFEQRERTGQLIAVWHWLDAGLPADLGGELSTVDGLTRRDAHAGALETALMLYAAPGFVEVENVQQTTLAEPPSPAFSPRGPVSWGWAADDFSADGVLGLPQFATVELGKALFEHAIAGLEETVCQLQSACWPNPPKKSP